MIRTLLGIGTGRELVKLALLWLLPLAAAP